MSNVTDRPDVHCDNASASIGDRNAKITCYVTAENANDALFCEKTSWLLANREQVIGFNQRWKDPTGDYDIIESKCEASSDGLKVELELYTVKDSLFKETYFIVYGVGENAHRHPVVLYDNKPDVHCDNASASIGDRNAKITCYVTADNANDALFCGKTSWLLANREQVIGFNQRWKDPTGDYDIIEGKCEASSDGLKVELELYTVKDSLFKETYFIVYGVGENAHRHPVVLHDVTPVVPVESLSFELYHGSHKIGQSSTPLTADDKPHLISPGQYMVKCMATGSNPAPILKLYHNENIQYTTIETHANPADGRMQYTGSFSVDALTLNAHSSPQTLSCTANIPGEFYPTKTAAISVLVYVDRPDVHCDNASASIGDRNAKITCYVTAENANDALFCGKTSWLLANREQVIECGQRWKDPTGDYDIIESKCEASSDGLKVELELYTVKDSLFKETYFIVYGVGENAHRHPVVLHDVTPIDPVESLSFELYHGSHKIGQSSTPLTADDKPHLISPGQYMVKCMATGSNPAPILKLYHNENIQYTTIETHANPADGRMQYTGSFSVDALTLNAHSSPQTLSCTANIPGEFYPTKTAAISVLVYVDRPDVHCDNASASIGDRFAEITCYVTADNANDALFCGKTSWLLANREQVIGFNQRWKDPTGDYDIIESKCEASSDGLKVELELYTVKDSLFKETYFIVYGVGENAHRHPVVLHDDPVESLSFELYHGSHKIGQSSTPLTADDKPHLISPGQYMVKCMATGSNPAPILKLYHNENTQYTTIETHANPADGRMQYTGSFSVDALTLNAHSSPQTLSCTANIPGEFYPTKTAAISVLVYVDRPDVHCDNALASIGDRNAKITCYVTAENANDALFCGKTSWLLANRRQFIEFGVRWKDPTGDYDIIESNCEESSNGLKVKLTLYTVKDSLLKETYFILYGVGENAHRHPVELHDVTPVGRSSAVVAMSLLGYLVMAALTKHLANL